MYTDEQKRQYIREMYETNAFAVADPESVEKYKSFIEEGIEKDWVEALRAKGFGCYGGNEIFKTDWIVARDCMLKLIELTEDPFCYNTLGYLYYYGRCNGGKPDYEKAFQYFSVGAFNRVYESLYKLADMFGEGKGVPKNKEAELNIITQLYYDNLEAFCAGDYGCKFADIALRMGELYERYEQKHLERALEYYEQAAYAIEKRVELYDFYGDDRIFENIKWSVERVKSKMPAEFFTTEMVVDEPVFFEQLIVNSAGIDLRYQERDGKQYLKASRVCTENETQCTLISMPSLNYCKLKSSLELELINVTECSAKEKDFSVFVNSIRYNVGKKSWEFIYRTQVMFSVSCEGFGYSRK